MGLGFIGHELAATTAQDSPSPIPPSATNTTTTTSMSQQTQVAGPPTSTSSFIPVDRGTSEREEAHNTLLVGMLLTLAVGLVIVFGLICFWQQRRASRREREYYQAKVREQQRAADENIEAPSRMA